MGLVVRTQTRHRLDAQKASVLRITPHRHAARRRVRLCLRRRFCFRPRALHRVRKAARGLDLRPAARHSRRGRDLRFRLAHARDFSASTTDLCTSAMLAFGFTFATPNSALAGPGSDAVLSFGVSSRFGPADFLLRGACRLRSPSLAPVVLPPSVPLARPSQGRTSRVARRSPPQGHKPPPAEPRPPPLVCLPSLHLP